MIGARRHHGKSFPAFSVYTPSPANPTMRKPTGSASDGGEVRLGLTAHEDLDDEQVLAAAAGASGSSGSGARRRVKRGGCLRVLPWVLLGAAGVTFLLAMPGGLGVFLCACRMRELPAHPANVTLVGHRGAEWPVPGNTLQALRVGARAARFVHLDATLSADGVPFVLDGRLEHTTNGSGRACARRAAYLDKLAVAPPTHDPAARARPGQPCVLPPARGNASGEPCTYRVPRLEQVFADLPAHTRFMLQLDACAEGHARPAGCPPCAGLVRALQEICRRHFISQYRLYFVGGAGASKRQFMTAFPDATFLMPASHEYAHYTAQRFAARVRDEKWDGVAMSTALVAWRPDLGYSVERARAHRTTKNLIRFAMTVRTDWDAKIALCAGVKQLVVAEPQRFAKVLRYEWASKI